MGAGAQLHFDMFIDTGKPGAEAVHGLVFHLSFMRRPIGDFVDANGRGSLNN